MQRSTAPQVEHDRARQAIASMRTSRSLEEFEDHWKHFLHRLERAWNKTKAHYGRSPKWSNWSAPVEQARRTDPLLSYLCNARGAEEHTTNDITDREPGSVGIGLADEVERQPDGSVRIEHLAISAEPGRIQVESTQPLKIIFTPARTRMVTVTNRGRAYPVPSNHQGRTIDSTDLPSTAETALAFYAEVIGKAEAFFVK